MKAIKNLKDILGITAKEFSGRLGHKSIDSYFKKMRGDRAITDRDAEKLEAMSGVSWLAWRYPDKFFNPFVSGTKEQMVDAVKNKDKKSSFGAKLPQVKQRAA